MRKYKKVIKGYKVFQPDWTCRNMKFEVGKIYEENVTPECCKRGIHFCLHLEDCFIYYEFHKKNKVTEVLALGEVDFDLKNSKCCTNKIQIVRELDWQEVMDLLNIRKGYKLFPPNWRFKGKKFKVGKTYEENVTPKYGEKGFHYCLNLLDCLDYCSLVEKRYQIAEVLALGEIDFYALGRKCCSNKIKIIKNLNGYDALCLINTGHHNTGQKNEGDSNAGHHNIGRHNTGNENHGSFNAGSNNYGNRNTGSNNNGNGNTGSKNVGNDNTGCYNKGNGNTGSYNIGEFNSGRQNIGKYNTGNYNIGNGNSGDFNMIDFSSGCFNTMESKIYLFNKPSDWTHKIWIHSKAYRILNRICLTEWVSSPNLTEGILYHSPFHEACQKWWESLTEREKRIITLIPNFDADIFKKITGIDIKN